jgi:cytochrome c biogenesis protein CcmG/thiol:disulfide interchange protein DsbE
VSAARGPVVPILLVALGVAAGLGWYVAASRPEERPLVPGLPAPSFTLQRLDEGGLVSLDDLHGKVVYVNLWATWCAPCREEAPALERLYDSLRGEGFEVVAPTIDSAADREKVRAFRDELKLRFPILLDADRQVYQRYGATGVPETYLVDAEGRLAEAYIGPRDWDDPRYARAIRELLAAAKGGHGAGG